MKIPKTSFGISLPQVVITGALFHGTIRFKLTSHKDVPNQLCKCEAFNVWHTNQWQGLFHQLRSDTLSSMPWSNHDPVKTPYVFVQPLYIKEPVINQMVWPYQVPLMIVLITVIVSNECYVPFDYPAFTTMEWQSLHTAKVNEPSIITPFC